MQARPESASFDPPRYIPYLAYTRLNALVTAGAVILLLASIGWRLYSAETTTPPVQPPSGADEKSGLSNAPAFEQQAPLNQLQQPPQVQQRQHLLQGQQQQEQLRQQEQSQTPQQFQLEQEPPQQQQQQQIAPVPRTP